MDKFEEPIITFLDISAQIEELLDQTIALGKKKWASFDLDATVEMDEDFIVSITIKPSGL